MVRAWYMDDSSDDQRLEHHLVPPKWIELDKLFKETGVLYWKVIVIIIWIVWDSCV